MNGPKVLMIGSECVPFAKTGGLADVMGALPKAVNGKGAEVRVITPMHKVSRDKWVGQTEVFSCMSIKIGQRSEVSCVRKMVYEGVTYYFIDNEYHFGYGIYKGGEAEREQYAFFTRAILELLPYLDFEPDILHLNDWHVAVLPLLLKSQYKQYADKKYKTILTIHNLQYQGHLSYEHTKEMLGIGKKYLTEETGGIGSGGGDANMMKAGILYADAVTTVSPTYAKEILQPEYGYGLEGVLATRKDDLYGILNGIDTQEFNPATDPNIAKHFDIDHLGDRVENKKALLEDRELEFRPDIPVIGMVGRLTAQKGFSILAEVMNELAREDLYFLLLGSGDELFEEFFWAAGQKYFRKMSVTIGYDEALARQIYAGSDFFLMPSQFEPCGLAQMISQRYGALPIVHRTGGLVDTVRPFGGDAEKADGFAFEEYGAFPMMREITRALDVYKQKDIMELLVKNAMAVDNSFDTSSREYVKLYDKLAGEKKD